MGPQLLDLRKHLELRKQFNCDFVLQCDFEGEEIVEPIDPDPKVDKDNEEAARLFCEMVRKGTAGGYNNDVRFFDRVVSATTPTKTRYS